MARKPAAKKAAPKPAVAAAPKPAAPAVPRTLAPKPAPPAAKPTPIVPLAPIDAPISTGSVEQGNLGFDASNDAGDEPGN